MKNKMPTKEELLRNLESYNNILNKNTQDYLKSLINLEISCLNDQYIDSKTREQLLQLDLVDDISKYNIYYKALEILTNYKYNLSITRMKESFNGLNASIDSNDKKEQVFNYMITNNQAKIELFETDLSKSLKQRRMDKILDDLDILFRKEKKSNNLDKYIIRNKMDKLENEYETLDNAKYNMETINMQKEIVDKISKDYGIEKFPILISDYDNMHKKMIKEYPKVKVIKYKNFK